MILRVVFLRGRPELAQAMTRLIDPGKRPDPRNEPNFYDIAKRFPLPEDSNNEADEGKALSTHIGEVPSPGSHPKPPVLNAPSSCVHPEMSYQKPLLAPAHLVQPESNLSWYHHPDYSNYAPQGPGRHSYAYSHHAGPYGQHGYRTHLWHQDHKHYGMHNSISDQFNRNKQQGETTAIQNCQQHLAAEPISHVDNFHASLARDFYHREAHLHSIGHQDPRDRATSEMPISSIVTGVNDLSSQQYVALPSYDSSVVTGVNNLSNQQYGALPSYDSNPSWYHHPDYSNHAAQGHGQHSDAHRYPPSPYGQHQFVQVPNPNLQIGALPHNNQLSGFTDRLNHDGEEEPSNSISSEKPNATKFAMSHDGIQPVQDLNRQSRAPEGSSTHNDELDERKPAAKPNAGSTSPDHEVLTFNEKRSRGESADSLANLYEFFMGDEDNNS